MTLVLMACSNTKPVNIWMIGDSTMAAKKASRLPESGWGEGLKAFVTPNTIVHNHAASGRSTRSFIEEGRWQNVVDSLQAGDFVIIQFGHNDQKPDAKLHTEPYGEFVRNLEKFVRESERSGAFPIICSSIVRRHFTKDGKLTDTHGDYILAAKAVAANLEVPFVDMEHITRTLVTGLGVENSKAIYTHTAHKADDTHLSTKGARVVAYFFAREVQRVNSSLARYLDLQEARFCNRLITHELITSELNQE
ncbi:lysophospholipase L1-like esterase [Marinoscillum furvescens DSM 4134]|uniref:Lysophospholipase L1-like esterase n=2 Tax=Marinoscillum furvescens TaxID=1026 RepID=A0A3D9LIL8_MARFU|nr:lysophospholipase L1-like esterase [Marinoscillum furvescens DSM 4134]